MNLAVAVAGQEVAPDHGSGCAVPSGTEIKVWQRACNAGSPIS